MPLWARLIVALAACRVSAALVLYAGGLSPDPALRPIPLGVFAVLAATFTAVALGLAITHADDRRAAWLGGTLALVGSPLAVPLVPEGSVVGDWLFHVRPEAFLGAFVWEFVACFPSELQGPERRLVKGIAAAGWAIGIGLAGVLLLTLWIPPDASSRVARLLAIAVRPSVFYWPMLLAVTVPAFFGLFWRATVSPRDDRQRLVLFGIALLVGLAPFGVQVLLEGLFPTYAAFAHRPAVEPWIGAVLFTALASLPITTAYSVLFDRVVSVRLVMRSALQYALARYTILALTLIPFGGLLLFVAEHRNEPLVSLLSGTERPAVLVGLAIIGTVALRLRPRLMGALDRRYFREPYDAAQVFGRLMKRPALGPADLGERLCDELGRALHARVHVLLADADGGILVDPAGRLPPLSAMTPLVALADSADPVLDVNAPAVSADLGRLPDHERLWLEAGPISLLALIRSHDAQPVGLIALTPKRSELPYTSDDRRFVSMVASAAGLAFAHVQPRVGVTPDAVSVFARECERCGTVFAPDARRCLCGGALTDAPVPHVLRGIFRFEQRIASGSDGIVYRAVDLGLGRNVAIKTLPVTRDRAAALVLEARAMARMTHVNLAVVHGVESWNDVSFLVQEYLEGGTLAQRLTRSRFDVESVIDLGIILADLLTYLHRHDLVHCDIKPSNIGYTAEGIVKLFDFGLARRPSGHAPAEETGLVPYAGTPFYMSPESVRGEPPSPSVDLWALAVVMYEAICSRRPFDGRTTPDVLAAILRGRPLTLSEVVPGTPIAVARWVEQALDRDPGRRPQTAADVHEDLLELRRSLRVDRRREMDAPFAQELHG